MIRLRVTAHGVVQGVGFRPFVARESQARGLAGFVRNQGGLVEIEVEGEMGSVDGLLSALRTASPPISVTRLDRDELEPRGESGFRILESSIGEVTKAVLPPDLAPCRECLAELWDPADRRYRYPFTSCTRCGPRFSIVHALPHDRERTSMREFPPCNACREEYANPDGRRYHAESIACFECGPTLRLVGRDGASLALGDEALIQAAALLRAGKIVALKGLGGFQLLVCAGMSDAVSELRRRKRRDEKPFAVMFPTLSDVEQVAVVTDADRALLESPTAPIVLLALRRDARGLAPEVAPGNPDVGALLPSTPLHALLLGEVGLPVVCTSGNLSSEPLTTSLDDARARLSAVADVFLDHEREVVRPIDDSVVRVRKGEVSLSRRARGYAPDVVGQVESSRTLLGVGAQLKSSLALVIHGEVVMSQHLGDLGHVGSEELLDQTADDLLRFFRATPELIACDLHPDYVSTRFAERLALRVGAKLVRIPHHAAHVAAVALEHRLSGNFVGLAWDGIGLGEDGALWGGEVFRSVDSTLVRSAHLLPLPLLGGDRAAREPFRSALGALWLLEGDEFFRRGSLWLSDAELRSFARALERRVHVLPCSSVGRLFDAVAALLGIRTVCSFEGQAAMELEYLARRGVDDGAYPLPLSLTDPGVADTRVLLTALLADLDAGVPRSTIARRFHSALADFGTASAARADTERVVAGGGCFQNSLLVSLLEARLRAQGQRLYTAQRIPTNDGGIAAGQVALAAQSAIPPVPPNG